MKLKMESDTQAFSNSETLGFLPSFGAEVREVPLPRSVPAWKCVPRGILRRDVRKPDVSAVTQRRCYDKGSRSLIGRE